MTDPVICKEILTRRPKRFQRTSLLKHPNDVLKLHRGLFNAEGQVWSQVRKAIAPSFSNQNITQKFSVLVKEVIHWIRSIQAKQLKNEIEEDGAPIDMKRETFLLTIRIITIVAFGLDPDDPLCEYFFNEFNADVKVIFTFLDASIGFHLPKWLWKYSPQYALEVQGVAADARFTQACQRIINFKRELAKNGKLPMNCMMDTMIAHQADGVDDPTTRKLLTDEEIIANVKVFYIAGSDTTSVILSWMMYYFALFPDLLDNIRKESREVLLSSFPPTDDSFDDIIRRDPNFLSTLTVNLFKDLKYTQAAGKETLRLKPPAIFLFLETLNEKVTLSNGIVLDEREFVFVNTDGLHYDPLTFPEPEKFNPNRWLEADERKLVEMESSFLPFGFGPRICPGMNLANLEIAVTIAIFSLFVKKVNLKCPKDEIERIVNFIVQANKMPVHFEFFPSDA